MTRGNTTYGPRRASPEYRRLIGSKRWRRLRAWKLRAQPLCEDCLHEGRATAATEVHHVRPLEQARSREEMRRLCFDAQNLRSLCPACHEAEHRRLASRSAETQQAYRHAEAERFAGRFLDN